MEEGREEVVEMNVIHSGSNPENENDGSVGIVVYHQLRGLGFCSRRPHIQSAPPIQNCIRL